MKIIFTRYLENVRAFQCASDTLLKPLQHFSVEETKNDDDLVGCRIFPVFIKIIMKHHKFDDEIHYVSKVIKYTEEAAIKHMMERNENTQGLITYSYESVKVETFDKFNKSL